VPLRAVKFSSVSRQASRIGLSNELQRQLSEAEQEIGRELPLRRLIAARDRGEPVEHSIEHDLRLDPRQRRAETIVDAGTEAEVFALVAVERKSLGIREHRRIAIARAIANRTGWPWKILRPPISISRVTKARCPRIANGHARKRH